MSVHKIIYLAIFIMMLISLLANPAPVSIEMADLILIGLPFFLGILCLAVTSNYVIHQTEARLLVAVILYLCYLLLSMLLGLLHGVPLLGVLRSIGPYVNFFPLILMSFLPIRFMNPWRIGYILMLVGFLQADYHLYLYFSHTGETLNTFDILKSRITLIEPRTTLPLILSLAILPLAFFSYKRTSLRLLAMTFIMLGCFASIATLTRSVILAIMMGIVTFTLLNVYMQSRSKTLLVLSFVSQLIFYSLLLILGVVVVSMIPKIRLLEQGLFVRFFSASSIAVNPDYSNGRLYDEWIPALNTWRHSDVFTLLFGIGAGNAFTVASGEERTYIHNLSIYTLVYGGIFGLCTSLWLYFTVFRTLILRALQTHKTIYLSLASLLLSLFVYAQLFAVHKGLAFNAMLFLIITLALCQPESISKPEGHQHVWH